MWLLPWALLAAEGCRGFGLFFLNLFFLFFYFSFCFSFFLKNFISITAPAQTFEFLWVFFCGSFLGLGNLAGETTAVWWPPSPCPYPLLLRIRKKPAPVYSGRKFPFSTQPNGASTLSSPFPTQQLCLWHRVGRRGIGRALRGKDHLKGSWVPFSSTEDLLASPRSMEMAAEDAAAGYSLPAHSTL